MSEAYFYRTHDREFGPVSMAELSRMIRQRVLVPGTLIEWAPRVGVMYRVPLS